MVSLPYGLTSHQKSNNFFFATKRVNFVKVGLKGYLLGPKCPLLASCTPPKINPDSKVQLLNTAGSSHEIWNDENDVQVTMFCDVQPCQLTL